MKLYSILENGQIKTSDGISYGLVEYEGETLSAILDEANKYYLKEEYEDWYTDFNDKEEDSEVRKKELNEKNIVVKDNAFYGALCFGAGNYDRCTLVVSVESKKVSWSTGSYYSGTSYDWELIKNDLDD